MYRFSPVQRLTTSQQVVREYFTPPVICIQETLTSTPGQRVSIQGMLINVSINYFLPI